MYGYTRNNTQSSSMSHRIQGCTHSIGSFGGGGGGAFNDLPDECNGIVRVIRVYAGKYVDGLDITYRKSDGSEVSILRGGTGGGRHTIEVKIDEGERIIAVFGKSGGLLDQIGFVTSHGRIFGPYGGSGGGNFNVNSCELRGIYGRAGGLIDSIGFFCSKPTCAYN